jgi:hypothetical protein
VEEGVKAVKEEEEKEEEEDQLQHHPLPTLQLWSLQLLMSDPWEPYQLYSPVTEPKYKTS